MKGIRKGFTIIELMVSVMVVGLFVAVAVPRYEDYMMRSRWTLALADVQPLQRAIVDCNMKKHSLAACITADQLGLDALPTPSGSSAAVKVTSIDGTRVTLEIQGGTILGGCTVTLTGVPTEHRINWTGSTLREVKERGYHCSRKRTGV